MKSPLLCFLLLASIAIAQAPANDACGNAAPLAPGDNYGTLLGATPTNSGATGCIGFDAGRPDVWYVFNSPSACRLTVAVAASVFVGRVAVYGGTCGALTATACGGSAVTVDVPANTPQFVRVASTSTSLGLFKLECLCEVPVTNDDCLTALPVYDGINPTPATGTNGIVFSNNGATSSTRFADPCGGFGHLGSFDVFFEYVATCSAVTIDTCTPSGFLPGTLADTMLSVYDVADCQAPTFQPAPLACNDDSACTPKASRVAFETTVGATYLIRVSSWATNLTGSFYLTIRPAASFSAGPGCNGIWPSVPTLESTPLIIGQTMTVSMSGFAANSPGYFFIAYCALTPIMVTSTCPLYLAVDSPTFQALVPFYTDGSGNASFSGLVPNIAGLQCKSGCAQAVVAPLGGGPAFQLSNGIRIYLGN